MAFHDEETMTRKVTVQSINTSNRITMLREMIWKQDVGKNFFEESIVALNRK